MKLESVVTGAVSPPFCSEAELHTFFAHPLPRHVAIIMDGNRRWLKKKSLGKLKNICGGYWAGANVLTHIVEAASNLGTKVLTVYGFSTENWSRPTGEIEVIFQILKNFLESNRQKMVEQQIRFHTIGDLALLPADIQSAIALTRQVTKEGKGMDFVVALNYGGRDEMKRVMQRLGNELLTGRLTCSGITEEVIAHHLDTAPFGDPDLLIRTSGEKRVSNFLLWQLAYTEFYITDTLWPDFTPRDLLIAMLDFQQRQRRKGK